ncbi:hypothetical protein GFM13_23440 [Rhizobium leguminosarum bv. viciae]|nr:hypothetical protein [Rhizobium leguminosarum bv. viciae]
MTAELTAQQQLALYDALREVRINLQAAKDRLKAEPNPQEQATEEETKQKIANLENALIVLGPLAKKVGA